MKKLISVVSSLLLAMSVFGVLGQTTHAASTSTGDCEIHAQFADPTQNFTINSNGTATVRFNVTGTNNCTTQVTVASWNSPNGTDGKPFESQTLVDSKSGTFNPGIHTLTVAMPKCFYQLDLLRGLSPTMLGSNNYLDWQFVSARIGGAACVTPTPTPATPVTPSATPATPVPTHIVNTGPANLLGIFAGVSVAAAVAYRLFIARRLSRQ